jgi:hypothetical protein
MERIKDLFAKRGALPKSKRATERGDLLDIFLARLNPPRKSAGYRPLTHARLAYRLTGIKTADLYSLLSSATMRRGAAIRGARSSGRKLLQLSLTYDPQKNPLVVSRTLHALRWPAILLVDWRILLQRSRLGMRRDPGKITS